MFIIIYINQKVQESTLVLILQYLPVYVLFFWEVYKKPIQPDISIN
jgi:hypothetical protein